METDSKPILGIDADENVLKCAKGLDVSACGYFGGPVCAKCGAKPVMMKMVPLDETGESKGMKPMMGYDEMAESEEEDADEAVAVVSMSRDEKQYLKTYGIVKYKQKYKKNPYLESLSGAEMKSMMENAAQITGMEEEVDMVSNRSKKGMGMPAPSMNVQDMTTDEDEDITEEEKAVLWEINRRRKARGLVNTMNSMASEKDMHGDEEEDEEKMYGMMIPKKKNMHGDMPMEEEDEEKMYGMNTMPKKKKGMGMGVPMIEEEDEEKMYDMLMPKKKKNMHGDMPMDEEEDEDSDLTDEEKALIAQINKRRQARGLARTTNAFKEKSEVDVLLSEARDHRIESMGLKWDDLGEDGYICSIERKSHSGSQSVCDDCEGGCLAEKGLPGLLHVEGLAEQEFKGIVIDSGYSSEADMFVVDVQVKDGSIREVFIDGTTAEIVGFHKLDDNIFEQKSAVDELLVISFVEAAEIAVKSIDGTIIAVEPDIFEGIDSYAVEIDGVDGKSYDVFVGLDGEVLGYDRYEPEEAEDIEAEAAEIALKKAFSDDRRMAMAKEGTAMPDGSYPIASEDDLKNAIQSYGRAKDKEAAKLHIMKRANEMGKESMIPSAWVMGGGMSRKGDSSLDAGFMKSLIEFELLQSDEELS